MLQSVTRASRILLTVAGSPHGVTASEGTRERWSRYSDCEPPPRNTRARAAAEQGTGQALHLGSSAADIANEPGLRARVKLRHSQALRQLAEVTRETAFLTGWFRGGIRILATVEGSQAPRCSSPFAHSERPAQILDNLHYTRFTPVPVDHAGLEAQMAEIQGTGIVYDSGE